MGDSWYHACHRDEQGSTAYLTGEDGSVENSCLYDAFGNELESLEGIRNRIKYTGQQYDPETGQYYLRVRYYNPLIGRFTQEDTYRGDGLNLYAYCGNNPVVYYDPSEHTQQCGEQGTENLSSKPNDVPEGYYQDSRGRWHRPDGRFASNEDVGLLKPNTSSGNSRGGRLESDATREQNKQIADSLESEGYTITGGGGRQPEEYLSGPNGGNKGSNYVDVTAQKEDNID